MSIHLHDEKVLRARVRRDLLWNACLSWKEDERIESLVAYCTQICDGDARAGVLLASEAIWS